MKKYITTNKKRKISGSSYDSILDHFNTSNFWTN